MDINNDVIKAYYRDKLHEFGSSAKGMDWKNQDSQYLRFEILSRYIDFSSTPTILDVGCGNAEFLNFCHGKNLTCLYTGLDLVPEMVELANNRFGEKTAFQGELLLLDPVKRYDYVIASGTFNAKLATETTLWRKYFLQNVEKMFQLSEKAAVFNCMSGFVDYEYERLYYSNPMEISDFSVSSLSRRFIIDHSYPLFEMTIAIFSR